MRPPTRTTPAKKLKPFVECFAAKGWEEVGVFTRYQLALKRSLPDLSIHFNHTYTMTHEELRHAKSYANDTLSHMHTQNKSTAAGHTAGAERAARRISACFPGPKPSDDLIAEFVETINDETGHAELLEALEKAHGIIQGAEAMLQAKGIWGDDEQDAIEAIAIAIAIARA